MAQIRRNTQEYSAHPARIKIFGQYCELVSKSTAQYAHTEYANTQAIQIRSNVQQYHTPPPEYPIPGVERSDCKLPSGIECISDGGQHRRGSAGVAATTEDWLLPQITTRRRHSPQRHRGSGSRTTTDRHDRPTAAPDTRACQPIDRRIRSPPSQHGSARPLLP
jgi:hypothetical protein